MKMKDLLGMRLEGYCEGYFGRDGYGDKIIVHVGKRYIVVETVNGNRPMIAHFEDMSEKEIIKLVKSWEDTYDYANIENDEY